jgi:hypothetical protein
MIFEKHCQKFGYVWPIKSHHRWSTLVLHQSCHPAPYFQPTTQTLFSWSCNTQTIKFGNFLAIFATFSASSLDDYDFGSKRALLMENIALDPPPPNWCLHQVQNAWIPRPQWTINLIRSIIQCIYWSDPIIDHLLVPQYATRPFRHCKS